MWYRFDFAGGQHDERETLRTKAGPTTVSGSYSKAATPASSSRNGSADAGLRQARVRMSTEMCYRFELADGERERKEERTGTPYFQKDAYLQSILAPFDEPTTRTLWSIQQPTWCSP
jgi:hypothetical protein